MGLDCTKNIPFPPRHHHDETEGSYLEFGVFTGNSFNFAMKINKRMEKLFKKKLDIEFIGFD